jgi:8-oxo-dGTP pyrophosphatase MutT (NUDIX family)
MPNERHDDNLARWAREGKTGTPPVPAATVIVLRDTDAGLETLMLRKASKIAFGGMWVFPGGRVDPEDSQGLDPNDDLRIAQVAAAREAEEEAGLRIELESLVSFSHWTPPPITPKRFLTWFFLAPAPSGEITIDNGEIRDHAWMSVRDAFKKRDAGQIEMAPPTWVTLHRLAQSGSVADALAEAEARAPQVFATHIGVTDAGPIAMWQGDAGWDASDPGLQGERHRLSMLGGTWRYDCTVDH